MAQARVGATVRWVAVGAVACAGLLVLARETPAAPTKVTRPAPELTARETRLVELGRRLFFEPTITPLGRNSCGSCHDPEHGFSDRAVRSRDDFNLTPRHSQALIDVDTSMPLHWDGSIKDLREIGQRRTRFAGGGGYTGGGFTPEDEPFPVPDMTAREEGRSPEQAETDLGPGAVALRTVRGQVLTFVAEDGESLRVVEGVSDTSPKDLGRYAKAFEALGSRGDPAVLEALEAYVKSLRSTPAPFDRHRAGETEALSVPAARGLDLFKGRAGCAECHRIEVKDGWVPLRDGQYHNTGLAWMGRLQGGKAKLPDGVPTALREEMKQVLEGDRGRAGVEKGATQHLRAFKTPTLRDVATHPPYMHDGSLATLTDVVKHYAGGCGDDPQRDARLKPGFEASEQDVADLVAFLEALTSGERPGLAPQAWSFRALRTRLKFMDAAGEPLPGLKVSLACAGDRATRLAVTSPPRELVTDAKGEIVFTPTLYTHVRLGLPDGLVPRGGTLVPDTCEEAEIHVPVRGRVRLAMVVPDGVEAPATLRTYPVVSVRLPEVEVIEQQTKASGGPLPPAQVVEPEPWPLMRSGVVDVGGRSAVLYEGWVPSERSTKVLFRLPGQKDPQEANLTVGETQRIEIKKG